MRRMGGRTYAARLAFWCIRVIHGPFMAAWQRDPAQTLRAMGLRPGLRVLEVGCGPGGYTVPAAEIVGKHGRLLAVDTNPYAVHHVRDILDQRGLAQAQVAYRNAADTGLPAGQTDLVFFIGVPRIVGGLETALREVRRILAPGGTVAFHLGRHDEVEVISVMEGAGFRLWRVEGLIRIFRREEVPIGD